MTTDREETQPLTEVQLAGAVLRSILTNTAPPGMYPSGVARAPAQESDDDGD